MPSKYEPCGLNQIYSLKYGTIPIVRATGGLDDTIVHYDPATGNGNGFKFIPYNGEAFLQQIKAAIHYYHQPEHWKRLLRNAMTADFSWQRSAESYVELYRRALEKKRELNSSVSSIEDGKIIRRHEGGSMGKRKSSLWVRGAIIFLLLFSSGPS